MEQIGLRLLNFVERMLRYRPRWLEPPLRRRVAGWRESMIRRLTADLRQELRQARLEATQLKAELRRARGDRHKR